MAEVDWPAARQGWRHYSGHLYWIMAIGHDAITGKMVVIYSREPDGSKEMWTRPIDDFLGYTEDKRRRFVLERASP